MTRTDFKRSKISKTIITQDDVKIRYDHYPSGNDNLVILAHGFFNSKDSVLLLSLGEALWPDYDVLLLDFRGHGESQGLFHWTTKESVDLIAVLEKERSPYQKLALIGFSLGAATSIITAAKCDLIDSLIAVSGPTEFEKINYHFWEIDVENDIFFNLTGAGRQGKGVRPGPFWLKKDKPIHVVSKVKCPIFFIHGDTDWLIKPEHSQALFDQAVGDKAIAFIKNGPHAEYLMRKNPEETVGLIKGWLAKTLKGREECPL